ncbi:MAG: hypothetical protein QNJ32_25560 [Xenococcaceae cyanobacterium MO_167.B27]|nr:hypothetical protein [Xenococcaceae cyanobacterium MO_167.B27]
MELVKFDCHKIQNPEISNKEYQQGTLYQYEVREYLLLKFNRTCAYCGAKDVPLEVEHIKPSKKMLYIGLTLFFNQKCLSPAKI